MAPQQTDPASLKGTTHTPLAPDTIQVDDKVYSAVSLSQIHPGGDLFVKAFAGRDATEAFLSYHRKRFPHAKVKDFLVGRAVAAKDASVDEDYLELCGLVEQVLPRHKAFAPLSYYLKLFVILSVSVGLELYMHLTGTYVWYLSAILGFFLALIGLNIQHDANHGSISKQAWVNRVLGYTQNWIGGSHLDWIHQHVVQHHVETNDIHTDPDIEGSAILRLNPFKPLLSHHILQHVYLFILISVFGYLMIFTSLDHVVRAFHTTPFSTLVAPLRKFEMATTAFFLVRWFVIPLLHHPSVMTLLHIMPMFFVGGYYLAFFFILSHNFEGVHMFDKSAATHTDSFLYKQVTSSSNVGGAWLAVLNGGLNYQIEHHLFPRIQHSHYATIAPLVREYCAKKNIPYKHFPTVGENFASCVKHLHQLGSQAHPSIPCNQ